MPSGNLLSLIPGGIKGVACDSQAVKKDFIFVALKGSRVDGHGFIPEAIRRGAKAVICQSPAIAAEPSGKVKFIKVRDTRQALAKVAAEFYAFPCGALKVVGVTGTNGKTTVTYLLEAVLKKARCNPAVVGTVNYRYRDKIIPAKNTTPGPLELQSLLAGMRDAAVDYALVEVSSHALDQGRTGGVEFHSAVFTNITRDHLDYHRTRENYFRAKLRLFKGLGRKAFAVVNRDDPYAGRILKSTPARPVTYGIRRKADFTACGLRLSARGTEFTLSYGRRRALLKTPLIGRHNLYNILAASAWAIEEGVGLTALSRALADFSCVPGRLERIACERGFEVFVDYAHTDDALSNVIRALRQVSSGRLIVLFGCGGERDRGKRPKMGRVATELADYAVITSDNPRSEDPKEIIGQVLRGVKKDNFQVEPDRCEAIRRALSLARPGDVVLLAGKGHENYQVLKDRTIDFDDAQKARECLRRMT